MIGGILPILVIATARFQFRIGPSSVLGMLNFDAAPQKWFGFPNCRCKIHLEWPRLQTYPVMSDLLYLPSGSLRICHLFWGHIFKFLNGLSIQPTLQLG